MPSRESILTAFCKFVCIIQALDEVYEQNRMLGLMDIIALHSFTALNLALKMVLVMHGYRVVFPSKHYNVVDSSS